MTCTCTESFGQTVHAPDCEEHERCPEEMRGIPIRCILIADHQGDHR
jgi:hypothetical protein